MNQLRILHIDSTNESFSFTSIDSTDPLLPGGRALALHLLEPYIKEETEEEVTVFAVGPLTGSGIPMAETGIAMAWERKGRFFYRSTLRGSFARYMAQNNIDAILLHGRSVRELDISIDDLSVTFNNEKELPEASILTTPDAARNGHRWARFTVDSYFTENPGGIGFCLARQGVRSMQIAKGTEEKRKHDSPTLKRLVYASPFLAGSMGLQRFGTATLLDLLLDRKLIPGIFKGNGAQSRSCNAPSLFKRLAPEKNSQCLCTVHCCMNSNGIPWPSIDDVVSMISRGGSHHCNPEYHSLIRKGLNPIARLYNSDSHQQNDFNPSFSEFLPRLDFRGLAGSALSVALRTAPLSIMDVPLLGPELLRKPVAVDPLMMDGKARMVVLAENQRALSDSLGFCPFINFAAGAEEMAAAFREYTGSTQSPGELLARSAFVIHREQQITSPIPFPEEFYTTTTAYPPLDRAACETMMTNYISIREKEKNND